MQRDIKKIDLLPDSTGVVSLYSFSVSSKKNIENRDNFCDTYEKNMN